MNYEEIVKVIELEYKDHFDGLVKTKFENKAFTQPNDEQWGHLAIDFGGSQNVKNCGAKMVYRQTGNITLFINTPLNLGSQKSYALAQKFVDVFANRKIENIETYEPFLSTPVEEDGLYKSRAVVRMEIEKR